MQTRDVENILAKHVSDKGLVSKTYKELVKFNSKKTKVNNLKMDKRSRYLTRETIQKANKHIKRCSTLYVIGDVQIKTTIQYSYTTIRKTEIQHTDTTTCWQGCQQQDAARVWSSRNSHPLLVGMQNDRDCLEDSWAVPYSYHTIQQSCSLVFIQTSWKHIHTKTCTQMFVAA